MATPPSPPPSSLSSENAHPSAAMATSSLKLVATEPPCHAQVCLGGPPLNHFTSSTSCRSTVGAPRLVDQSTRSPPRLPGKSPLDSLLSVPPSSIEHHCASHVSSRASRDSFAPIPVPSSSLLPPWPSYASAAAVTTAVIMVLPASVAARCVTCSGGPRRRLSVGCTA